MAWPLATANPDTDVISHLNREFEQKNAKARESRAAWEAERERLISNGVDLANKAATTRLESLAQQYEHQNTAAGQAKDALIAALTRKSNQATLLGEGVGEDFVRKLGAGGLSAKSALDQTQGGSAVRAFYDPGVRELPQRKLFVRSLLPIRQATGDRVQYVRQSVAQHAAAIVPAGQEKPKSVYSIERIEQPIVTIAHVSEAIDRALVSDLDSVVDFLNNQLTLGVLLAEEDEILNGPGPQGSPDHLLGITNVDGIFDLERELDESNADAIYRAITTIRAEGFSEADAVILSPLDWSEIRLAKAEGTGEYLSAPIVQADPDRLWGLPVVTSPVMAQGSALVGDFTNGAAWYDREDARITFAETGDAPGEELFTHNQLRWRAEERGALGVYFPQKFAVVSNLGPIAQLS